MGFRLPATSYGVPSRHSLKLDVEVRAGRPQYGRPTRRTLDMSAVAEIWRAGIDGREDRRIGFGSLPRWSPDGRTIAYIGRAGGQVDRR
jgi:Tol biopolymer transport system component